MLFEKSNFFNENLLKQRYESKPHPVYIFLQQLEKKEGQAFLAFKAKYNAWKQQVCVDEIEDIHPWQQFRQPVEARAKYTIKDTARFKPIRASKFKVKTSPKSIAKAAAKAKLKQY